MRVINLCGYIDETVWFGDEITPDLLHAALYGDKNQYTDDVHIRLNSHGGACNAATRMHDDIRAYPGQVRVTISGMAASAATVLAMSADVLEMTPGSLYMIHDPALGAWGNERDLMEGIKLLRACKESILNVYAKRCKLDREKVAKLMTETTWMDAYTALENGFIDRLEPEDESGLVNSAVFRAVDREEAEQKVQAWMDRRKNRMFSPIKEGDRAPAAAPAPEPDLSGTTIPPPTPDHAGTPIESLDKRLSLLSHLFEKEKPI